MKHERAIQFLIATLSLIWLFYYFFSYIKGTSFLVWIFGGILGILLLLVGLYQLIKFIIEKEKNFERLTYSILIFLLLGLIISNPKGLAVWETLDDEDYLVAHGERVGTLMLKPDNKFKYVCSNDFYFGSYVLRNDTLLLFSKKATPYMDQNSFATLHKSNDSAQIFTSLCLYQNLQAKRGRCLHMTIKKIEMQKLGL